MCVIYFVEVLTDLHQNRIAVFTTPAQIHYICVLILTFPKIQVARAVTNGFDCITVECPEGTECFLDLLYASSYGSPRIVLLS